jgi:UDP-N-acetylglucosamine--N-acetylmuramyl-(pentapeptide) pyrophosphoryl-undecaprenol N-acetylglucosamine transferase
MMQQNSKHKVIISGGGTGGHIFPAVAIANALKEKSPDLEILFVGAQGRMEMEKVPTEGYSIIGLPVSGFNRKNLFKNVEVLFQLFKSILQARNIIKEFKPDVAVGVGGYASGPLLFVATRMKVPCLIQEQNSYAGVTNRLLSRKVQKICVAYNSMNKYFPEDKIVVTGNPVRQAIVSSKVTRDEALKFFHLSESSKVLLIIGGSLGAGTINESLLHNLSKLTDAGIQVIWQTGKYYYDKIIHELENKNTEGIHVFDFISNMDYAYAVADVVISRSGAIAISELCIVGKPVILVPSPNVAEDHQTKNALALADQQAAVLVKDKEATALLVDKAIELLNDENIQKTLSLNISKMAFKDSASSIADEIFKLIE